MKKTLLLAFLASLLCGTVLAQKGEKSVSGGAMLSLPFRKGDPNVYLDNGWGAEINGTYKFTNRSAVQVQTGMSKFKTTYYNSFWKLYWVKAGYRYQFGASGFYLNGLLGPEFDWNIGDPFMSYTVGGGKRFQLGNKHFIDAGVDFVGGATEERVNLKLAYGFRWPRKP